MTDSLGQFIERHHPASLTSWSGPAAADPNHEQTWLFEFHHLSFRLSLSHDHQSLESLLVWDSHGSVRRRDLDPIRQDVRQLLNNLFSQPGRKWLKPPWLQMAVVQALERMAEYEEEAKLNADSLPSNPYNGKPSPYRRGWSADAISSWDEIVNNPHGLDVSTIKDTAHDLLGQTPEELTRDISANFRIIHIESVVRPDLLKRFLRYKAQLEQDLDLEMDRVGLNKMRSMLPPHSTLLKSKKASSIRREDVVADMLCPRVTFHGTPLKSVRSIIRHGFLKPGTHVAGKVVSSPRSGIIFDRGVYSSQSAAYAISYAEGQQEQTPLGTLPSMRLFICATVMGRTYTAGSHRINGSMRQEVHGSLIPGHDSHFDGHFEYIIHDERAMLPCYVVHLDLGSDEAKRMVQSAQADPLQFQRMTAAARSRENNKAHPRLERRELAPGDKKREAEARKAAAMKWFPYGFGSATGTRFVIEEVGEWQEEKHAFVADKEGFIDEVDGESSCWSREGDGEQKRLFLDGYQGARR